MKIPMKRLTISAIAALSLLLAPQSALAATDTPGAGTNTGTAATGATATAPTSPTTGTETANPSTPSAAADSTPAAGSAAASTSADQTNPNLVTIDLYNLTDIHGHIEKKVDKKKNKVTEAGLSAMACYINKARQSNPNSQFTLLGDNIGASPFTSGSQNDNPTIAALNEMNVFASTIGNHEFDKGISALKDRFEGRNGFTKIKFPYLGANVKGLDPYLQPYQIWTSPSGVKVAFIGAIEDDVATKLAPGTVDELTFEKPAPVINKIAAELKTSKQADIVIAMFDNDVERSYPLMGEHVDGIMGGDTHKPYYFTQVKASDGHTLSATASGSFTDNLSNLQFVYDRQSGKVVSSKAIQISADTVAACGTDPKVEAIVSAATKKAEAKKSEVVARNFANFYRGVQAQGENRGTESTLGGLIADSMKHSFKQLDGKPIDIGIINAGGIRADLTPQDGNLTVGDIFATQPFSNEVGYVKMTGAQFKTLLEQQWKKLGKNSSRPMLKLGLSANVKYTFDPAKPMGERITSILIDGKQIDPAKVYSVGSVTFLLAGGDSFDILKDPAIAKTLTPIAENLDRDSFQKYLAANPQVQPRSAVSSVGVTLNHKIDGLNVTASVDLRGLSFSHESEAQTKKVTVKLGTASATADVNNTLEDANAAKEKAIVTADGVGYLNKPIELTTTAKCAANAKSVFIPLTVLNEKGVELVSAAAGIGVHVPCPHAAAKPGTSSGNANIVGITNNAGATSAVVDANANNGQAKATNPRLAKTGSEAAGLLALALLAGILGLAGVAAARRKNA